MSTHTQNNAIPKKTDILTLHHAGGWLILIYHKCAVNEEGVGGCAVTKETNIIKNRKAPPCSHDSSFAYFTPATFCCCCFFLFFLATENEEKKLVCM